MVISARSAFDGLDVSAEGRRIAKRLNEYGITGGVLEYRVPKERHVQNIKIRLKPKCRQTD